MGLLVHSVKPWPNNPPESWHWGRHLLLTTEILCFWEPVRKKMNFVAQIQCYVKYHCPQSEKIHSSISSSNNARLPLGQQHPGTAAPSKSSHLSARTRDICLQILPFTPPFLRMQEISLHDCSQYFIFTWEIEFARNAGWHDSKRQWARGDTIACIRKAVWDAWSRLYLHWLGMSHVRDQRNLGQEHEEGKQTSFSVCFWPLFSAGWMKTRMSREGSWLPSPFGTGGMKGCQQQAEDRAPTLFPCPPTSSFLTSLKNDSVGKIKEIICFSWKGAHGNITSLLPSSLGEQTFTFSVTS